MAGELRVSMLIEANAARAKAEVSAMREEVAKLAGAGEAAQGGMAAAGAGTAEWGSAVQMLRASLQPMAAEANALAAAADQLAFAEESGAISAREAAMAHDMLARAAIDLQGRMDAMGVTLDGSSAAMTRHETAVQQLIARNTGLGQSEEASIADHLRHGQALDALREKFNPLFAASRQYELVLGEIAEAERLGAISATEAAAARERASAALTPASAQMVRFGTASQQSSQHVMQLGYQLNDIGMMMAMGQSPFMLMMQQGPQVVQVFDNMRAQGVSLGATLRSSFAMFLNPVNFATLAIIGFGAAAVQWFGQAEQAAETVSDAIGRLRDIENSLSQAHDILNMTLPQLYEKYGRYALVVREATKAVAELQAAEARAALGETLTKAADAMDRITSSRGRGVVALANEMGMTVEQALALQGALLKVQEASSFEERTSSLRELQQVMAAAGISAEQLPTELRQALIQSEQAVVAMADLANATENAETAMYRLVASAPGGGWLAGAIADAASLAGTLWNAAAAAAAAAQARANAQNQLDQMKFEFSPGGQALMTYGSRAPGGTAAQDALANRNTPKSPGSGSGAGGGGGGGGADRQADALKRLREEQERQITLLRTTDPVQRIILENHEALAKATEKEKKEVVGLILERERLEKVKEQVEEIGQTLGRAFVDWTTGANSFSDALSNVLESLAEMAASAVWDMFWEGTGNGDTGLSGLVAGWLGLPAKAEGGRVNGPGGPRDDKVLTRLSNGEYVVNARSTAEHLPFLEAINNGASLSDLLAGLAGSRPIALADGGYIGDWTGSSAPRSWTSLGSSRGGSEGGGGQRQAPLVQIVNQSREPIHQVQSDGPDIEGTVKLIVGRQYARGEFDRQNKARYGVSPEIARR